MDPSQTTHEQLPHDIGRGSNLSFKDSEKRPVSNLSALDNPPYNLLIHTAPTNLEGKDYYHWHIEIFPRLTKVAGFEWGTGFYINTVPPEDAAKYLREVTIE